MQKRKWAILIYMKNTLESSKAFPIVAWSLIIGFALFTWTLTIHHQNELSDISSGIDRVEDRLLQLELQKAREEITLEQ